MAYTLGEAAKATGLTKSGISKAIKSGRITALRDDLGRYHIDPAELHRIYPPLTVDSQPIGESVREDTQGKLAELTAKLEAAQEQLSREREWSRELSRRLDEEATERRKLTALLTHQPAKKPEAAPDPAKQETGKRPKKRSLWGIFRKS